MSKHYKSEPVESHQNNNSWHCPCWSLGKRFLNRPLNHAQPIKSSSPVFENDVAQQVNHCPLSQHRVSFGYSGYSLKPAATVRSTQHMMHLINMMKIWKLSTSRFGMIWSHVGNFTCLWPYSWAQYWIQFLFVVDIDISQFHMISR